MFVELYSPASQYRWDPGPDGSLGSASDNIFLGSRDIYTANGAVDVSKKAAAWSPGSDGVWGTPNVDDDGDAAESVIVGRGHGQALDVEATTGEQARHASQNTGLVLDPDHQGVEAVVVFAHDCASWLGWTMTSELVLPAGTIG